MSSSIVFSGVDEELQGNTLVACHLHFPPCSRVVSFDSIQTTLRFDVPSSAIAVCATLVWRYGRGWLPHGRCRFSLCASSESKDVKHESTLDLNGTATLTFAGTPKPDSGGTLLREWFWVPTEHETRLKEALRHCQTWYTTERKALDVGIADVHMPFWNNMFDSVPGWFFAFDSPRGATRRYSHDEFKEVVELVKCTILGLGDGPIAPIIGALDVQNLMALSVTVFSMSISYEQDFHHNSGGLIERFSSNARMDGVGDCEDIAKEACMAHADLCALAEKKFISVDFSRVTTLARSFTAVTVLGTVRRPDREAEAHAFCMLVPNEFFKERAERAAPFNPVLKDDSPLQSPVRSRLETLLCDGTYPCFPGKAEPSALWKRPWVYEFAISGIIMGQGEIFFHYEGDACYGVHFCDIFPVMKPNVTFAYTHPKHMDAESRKMACAVMRSNIPIQSKTFGFNEESIASRFLSNWSERSGDLERFKTMGGVVDQEEFVDCSAINEELQGVLQEENTSYREVSHADGKITQEGTYGTVTRPPELGKVAGHTHHREKGHDYRDFNPPTPSDLRVFVVHRVISKLASHNTPLDKIRQLETVTTHNHRYEITDSGKATGVVSTLMSRYSSQGRDPSNGEVINDTRILFEERGFGEGVGSALSKQVTEKMFVNEEDERSYIHFLETTGDIGLHIRRIPNSLIEERCARPAALNRSGVE